MHSTRQSAVDVWGLVGRSGVGGQCGAYNTVGYRPRAGPGGRRAAGGCGGLRVVSGNQREQRAGRGGAMVRGPVGSGRAAGSGTVVPRLCVTETSAPVLRRGERGAVSPWSRHVC